MKKVPKGKRITINQIRTIIAQKHGASIGCPITTGIFAWIASHAAHRALRKVRGPGSKVIVWRLCLDG